MRRMPDLRSLVSGWMLGVAMALFLVTGFPWAFAASEDPRESFPELGEIQDLLRMPRPEGLIFLVMDHDQEAYGWVLPRIERYADMLRDKWPDLPLVVLSHGDEIFSLLSKNSEKYTGFHERIRALVMEKDVLFQVCGAFAALSGVDESDFADFVDVVPSAPYAISDYRLMGYKLVHVELTW